MRRPIGGILGEKYTDLYELRVVLNEAAIVKLRPLIDEIKYMCDVGASRTVKIEEWDERGRRDTFGFDGDGADEIKRVESRMIENA
jgi:hypothetical protein